MNLTEALTAPLDTVNVDEAVAVIGQEKLRIRRAMDWRQVLMAWEVGLSQKGNEEQWRRLRELNSRLAVLLAHVFRSAGHKW